MEAVREFDFSDRDFNLIRDIVKEHTGISLSDAKRDLVYGRITRRLRALNLKSFSQYCTLLKGQDPVEFEQFTNAITTNLTSFFREQHHFDYLSDTLLPDLMARNQSSRRLRIWSAGCSTGEEVYSIAMTLLESMPGFSGWDVKLLATDLDSNVLDHARRGVYKTDRVAGLSKQQLQRWFLKGKSGNNGLVKVVPELQELVEFKQLNLMKEWPMRGFFDVIFCRNVVIYFDKPTQKILFDRYANILNQDAYMIIGHSENLLNVSDRFKLLGKTIYKKTA